MTETGNRLHLEEVEAECWYQGNPQTKLTSEQIAQLVATPGSEITVFHPGVETPEIFSATTREEREHRAERAIANIRSQVSLAARRRGLRGHVTRVNRYESRVSFEAVGEALDASQGPPSDPGPVSRRIGRRRLEELGAFYPEVFRILFGCDPPAVSTQWSRVVRIAYLKQMASKLLDEAATLERLDVIERAQGGMRPGD